MRYLAVSNTIDVYENEDKTSHSFSLVFFLKPEVGKAGVEIQSLTSNAKCTASAAGH